MNPQVNPYLMPVQGWPQQPQQQPSLNGNLPDPSLIPQMTNMNLGGSQTESNKMHQQMPPQQHFQNFNNSMSSSMGETMQQQMPTSTPSMRTINGPPPQSQPNNNFNMMNNNPMRPPSAHSVQNGLSSQINQSMPPTSQSQLPAVLPVQSEIIDNNQFPTVSQLNQDRPPSQNTLRQNNSNGMGIPPPIGKENVTSVPPGKDLPPPPMSTAQNIQNNSQLPNPPTFQSNAKMQSVPNSGFPPKMGSPQQAFQPQSINQPQYITSLPPGNASVQPIPTSGDSGFPVGGPSQFNSGIPSTSVPQPPTSTSGTSFIAPPKQMVQNPQIGFPPSSGTQQIPQQKNQGFPPAVNTQQISSFPPTSNAQQTPGFTPVSNAQQTPGFPPASNAQQNSGFPPVSNAQQTPGFPPASNAQQTPGFPPVSNAQQTPGFPPVSNAQQTSGFPPVSNAQQTPGYPPAPTSVPLNVGHPRNNQAGAGFPPLNKPQAAEDSSLRQPMMGGNQPPMPTQHPRYPQPQSQSGGYPTQFQQPGFPPMPVQPPMQNQPQSAGYPQMSGPGGFPGQIPVMGGQQQPPMPGMPPLPNQQKQMYGSHVPNMPQNMPPHMAQNMPPHMASNMPPQPGRNQQPPQPGMYNQMPGGYPPNNPGLPAATQQRRLDPDQMPNPIEVMNENENTCSGPFITNQAGLVPPLVTTEFITQDQGQTGPRLMRSSMYSVPATADMMKQTAVPFSLIISPFAKSVSGEMPIPIVDFGELGPVRCIRCKAYMSPNMQFIDAGRRFQCLLCKAITDVPSEYFQHLDHTGQRVDKFDRPELVLGTYEFVATKDYCRNNTPPKPPAIIFIIDVSYNNIKSGLVNLLCAEMKQIIQNLPVDQNCERSFVKVGFITYNNTVHFYNIKNNLAQPQMMIVGDVHEMFMPLLDGFLCDAEESNFVIDSLMEQIPKMFGDSRETETILLPAIQAGLEALKASECTGKLLVFNSSLPIAEAPGKLKNRDDRKLLGTDKEKTVLVPQSTAYNNLGQECVAAGCSVDLFVFNNSYIDVATIGQVSRLTGGEVYKYTYFQADIDGKRVVNDIIKNISRPIGFDAVMRVRTSTGVRPTDFYGHFYMSNTTDIELSSIDSDKSVAIEIKHDDKLPPEDNVYIQVALLYTSCSGQRRLRILNLALKTCTQMADMFRSCDLDSIMLFFAKQSIFKLMDSTPKTVKDNLIARCAQILACYRKNCATPISAGQLILPECMKLLPLYTSCILKNDSFSGGSDMTLDDRSYVMQFVLTMALPTSVKYIYPRLTPIHDVDPDETEAVPAQIRCSGEKMLDNGAYILENGIHMFIWLGLALAPEFCQSVFGVPHCQQIDTERVEFPVFDNPLSRRVREIVNFYQQESSRCMRVTFVRQRDKLEPVFKHFLVEDRGNDGTASYVDFLCHMHKEIRQLLS